MKTGMERLMAFLDEEVLVCLGSSDDPQDYEEDEATPDQKALAALRLIKNCGENYSLFVKQEYEDDKEVALTDIAVSHYEEARDVPLE